MKMIVMAATVCAAFVASAIERTDLGGLWDFSFADKASVADAKADFAATDKIAVPGCYDLMPKWYARRALGTRLCSAFSLPYRSRTPRGAVTPSSDRFAAR